MRSPSLEETTASGISFVAPAAERPCRVTPAAVVLDEAGSGAATKRESSLLMRMTPDAPPAAATRILVSIEHFPRVTTATAPESGTLRG
eukprot:5034410-Prymnesium_polylepis.1